MLKFCFEFLGRNGNKPGIQESGDRRKSRADHCGANNWVIKGTQLPGITKHWTRIKEKTVRQPREGLVVGKQCSTQSSQQPQYSLSEGCRQGVQTLSGWPSNHSCSPPGGPHPSRQNRILLIHGPSCELLLYSLKSVPGMQTLISLTIPGIFSPPETPLLSPFSTASSSQSLIPVPSEF